MIANTLFAEVLARLIIVIAPIIFVQQYFLPWLLKKLRDDVNKAVCDKKKEMSPKEEGEYRLKFGFGSELHTEYRTRRLGYFSKIIGYSEIIFFGGLVFILMVYSLNLIKGGDYFLKVFGGWLVVKTVSNYDQWSHPIAGKSYFYISIFGTLLNAIFAVLIGVLFYGLFSDILKIFTYKIYIYYSSGL